MKKILVTLLIIVVSVASFTGCTDDAERLGPTLDISLEGVESPSLRNTSSTDIKVFTETNIGELYEVFSWDEADYGLDVAINYVLEIKEFGAADETFAEFVSTQNENFASVSNERLNDFALNTLKFAAEEADTVVFRVRAFVKAPSGNNPSVDVYSNTITRIITPFVASSCGTYCSMAIIGSATPVGWNDGSRDLDLRLADPENDLNTWTITTYMTAGAFKFRIGDSWDVNWGTSGTAGILQEGGFGNDIPVASAGYYRLTFNLADLSYSVDPVTANVYAAVGLVGPGSPAGDWPPNGVDAAMTKATGLTVSNGADHVWTGTSFTFTSGEGKIRADNDWTKSWGVSGGNGTSIFPSGYFDAADNTAFEAGTFDVWFHDVTGLFQYLTTPTQFTTVGIIGDATPGGWNADTDLIQDEVNPYLWSGYVTLVDGGVKFRAENDWNAGGNWGSFEFPEGIATNDGGSSDTKVKPGDYFIIFNSGTGEVKFLK